jgi:hypothetical protein
MGAGGAAADALREQLDTALAEKAAALKDVEYLSAQLQSLLDKRDDHDSEVRSRASLQGYWQHVMCRWWRFETVRARVTASAGGAVCSY